MYDNCGEIENFSTCGEILGNFPTIYALSCGEKLSPKSSIMEKKWQISGLWCDSAGGCRCHLNSYWCIIRCWSWFWRNFEPWKITETEIIERLLQLDLDDEGVGDERGKKNSSGLTFYWEERVPLSIAPWNAVNLLMEDSSKVSKGRGRWRSGNFLKVLDPSPQLIKFCFRLNSTYYLLPIENRRPERASLVSGGTTVMTFPLTSDAFLGDGRLVS